MDYFFFERCSVITATVCTKKKIQNVSSLFNNNPFLKYHQHKKKNTKHI